MIFKNRNKIPFINFGFNSQSITRSIGDEITVWQSEIFNSDLYEAVIVSASATKILTGLNKSIITFASVGTYSVYLNVSLKDKSRAVLISNTITVNIV